MQSSVADTKNSGCVSRTDPWRWFGEVVTTELPEEATGSWKNWMPCTLIVGRTAASPWSWTVSDWMKLSAARAIRSLWVSETR